MRWEEAGRAIAKASTAPVAPVSQDDFENWLTAPATTFKTAVEDNGLWRALWNDERTKHRREDIAQVIARATLIEHCRARDIDISREADCGRGPVDFKFARGWQLRGPIEVKHISSTQFADGADTQLPIYLKGEKARFGIYLCRHRAGVPERRRGAHRDRHCHGERRVHRGERAVDRPPPRLSSTRRSYESSPSRATQTPLSPT